MVPPKVLGEIGDALIMSATEAVPEFDKCGYAVKDEDEAAGLLEEFVGHLGRPRAFRFAH